MKPKLITMAVSWACKVIGNDWRIKNGLPAHY